VVGVAVGVLADPGVAGPVPLVFNASTLADQTQQILRGCADAGEEQMTPSGGVSFARGGGDHLNAPAPGIWLTIQACST